MKCVYVCACMYVYVCIYMYVYVSTIVYMSVCMCVLLFLIYSLDIMCKQKLLYLFYFTVIVFFFQMKDPAFIESRQTQVVTHHLLYRMEEETKFW